MSRAKVLPKLELKRIGCSSSLTLKSEIDEQNIGNSFQNIDYAFSVPNLRRLEGNLGGQFDLVQSNDLSMSSTKP
jgi:hypothetical protein